MDPGGGDGGGGDVGGGTEGEQATVLSSRWRHERIHSEVRGGD